MSLKLFRRKAYVGLDLGHHSLKAVQLEPTNGGYRITRYATIPTPPECIKEGVVISNDDMAAAIKQLLREGHISVTSAIIAVAGGSVVVRTVRIPKMAEATLRKSIRYEASRYVPTSVDDSFVEFEILGPSGDDQMEVLIVAAPKDIVDSRLKACQTAGLSVDIVDIEAFAMFRALVEADSTVDVASITFALVDIGASMTNVSVVSKGVFAMTRAVPQGGNTLTEALRSYFKLSPEDAESGKAQLDLSDLSVKADGPNENPPLRILQPHVDELIREIRRSINYYQSQQTDQGQPNPVQTIFLAGGGAKLKGIQPYLEDKLGIPVKPMGLFENPRFTYAGVEDLGIGLDLSVASGLAMRGLGRAA